MRKPTIVSSIKDKAFEFGTNYFKDKFENSKEEFLNYIEKTIEQKIKREVRKFIYSTIAVILAITGIIFVVFGALAALVHLTNLPNFFTPLLFGLILMLIAALTYLQKE